MERAGKQIQERETMGNGFVFNLDDRFLLDYFDFLFVFFS